MSTVRLDKMPKRATARGQRATVRGKTGVNSRNASWQWGWFPWLSLIGAGGLLVLALADAAGRADAAWADALFWTGLLIVVAPLAFRLLLPSPARGERVALLVLLGILLYAVRYLQYPLGFAFNDEFLQDRTLQDIIATNHLFSPNPLLPISPSYPGLELVTDALSSTTGLSAFHAALLVIGVGRIVIMLGLFLLFERISGSMYVATCAALAYTGNQLFLLFDTQFAYESLAIPLAIAALATLVTALGQERPRRALVGIASCLLIAIVITHHVTSFLVVTFLLLWSLSWRVLRPQGRRRDWLLPGLAGLGMGLAAIGWLFISGAATTGYLTLFLTNYWSDISRLVAGHGALRPLFLHQGPTGTPAWERVLSLVAAALALAGQGVGLWAIWRHWRRAPLGVALGLASLLYPISLALRFMPSGLYTAGRLTGYAFVPLAYVLAMSIQPARAFLRAYGRRHAVLRPIQTRPRAAVLTTMVIVLFCGGIVLDAGQTWKQTPGPYLLAADARSITPEGIDAAAWMLNELGPGHRLATDRTNQVLMGAYGRQQVVTDRSANLDVSPIFTAPHLGPPERALLARGRVRYLVVDDRLAAGLPELGWNFDGIEPGALQHTRPVSRGALDKFAVMPGVNRVYDSGNIAIYDVGVLDGTS
ncbi:MAG TPA: hypothetical protein VIC85_02000 [Ktedonobacterales bacterium]